jgi:hypothetical protein
MEWIYTKTKVRGRSTLELALDKMKEECRGKCTFFTILIKNSLFMQTYLIVSMDISGLDR